jgi:hypothetical protein
MEAPSEPKPKRKYVMTPERRAKLMANLEHARRAPKEKVYRKTPNRYAANIRNLAHANAKRREELENLRLNVENLFPAPEVPPPPIEPLGPVPGAPPAFIPPSSGAEELDQVTPLIAKRLRKLQAARRREGRSIMRVLTAAMNRSQPLSANEAFNLALQLLQCLDGLRVVEEARRLNDKIGHLLLKMIETRYGPEAQEGGVAFVTELERLREERRQRAAARRGERAAESGASESTSAEGGPAGATPEARAAEGKGGADQPGGSGGQAATPSNVATPKLPKTVEEFQAVLARALDLEGENAATVVQVLAEALWVRLHWWKWREEQERRQLEGLFQEKGAAPPESAEELHRRRCSINFILDLDEDFLRRLDETTEKAASALRWWLTERPLIGFRSRQPASPPAKAPVRASSDQPTQANDACGGPSSALA